MSEVVPFLKYFVEESLKKASLCELRNRDMNLCCHELSCTPVSLVPRLLSSGEPFSYKAGKTLNIYPTKTDVETFFQKSEQLIEALHNVRSQVVFEIRGNCKEIILSFHAEKSDIRIIDAAIKNFFPRTYTEIIDDEMIEGEFFVYDFVPDLSAPFYRSMTSYRGFVVSPLNFIPQMFLEIPESKTGIYQVLITPLPGIIHSIVEECVDIEWKAVHGAERATTPSEQAGAVNKKLEYKSPEFRSYYSCSFRLILPQDNLESFINAFIASYVYDDKAFQILSDYKKPDVEKIINERVSYHAGFLVNSHELTSILHIPSSLLCDKDFDDVLRRVPAGDYPKIMSKKADVKIGSWACGKTEVPVYLPNQRACPHVHVLGVQRSGKSLLLKHLAIEKFKNGESVFLIDPHGDLAEDVLKIVPKELIDKVVYIDFGLKDLTPLLTIRENLDASFIGAGKFSDDMSASMETITSTKNSQAWFGPKMAYGFACIFYIYAKFPELNFADLRLLVSKSSKGKVLREKIKSRITHPIILNFIDEIQNASYESMQPVLTRLGHLLLDGKSLRFFTLDDSKNKISLKDIMNTGKLCVVNLACGVIGKQRSSLLAGLFDSFINNLVLQRANIPFLERKPVTLIKDEFYLGPGDLDAQLSGLSKYQLSVIFAHQYLNQVEGKTRDVLATAGTQIFFKLRQEDAEEISRKSKISAEEHAGIDQFCAFMVANKESVKIHTPKPGSNQPDYSEEIKARSFDLYYLRRESDKQTMPVVSQKKTFDQI